MTRIGRKVIITGIIALALAACGGSSAPASPKSAAPTSYTDANGFACAHANSDGYCPVDPAASKSPVSPTAQASPAGPSCASQVTSWLVESDVSGISGNTVQHDITAIIFDAKAYQHYDASDPGAGQNFLNFLNTFVTNLTYTSTPNAPPSCADPSDLWGGDTLVSGTFLGDASNATNDTADTSQADSDVQAILNDFTALNAELLNNSGVQAKGYAGTP